METREGVSEALAFVRGLVANPASLLAVRMRDGGDIVVIERGAGGEGELVAVRLTHGVGAVDARSRAHALATGPFSMGCA